MAQNLYRDQVYAKEVCNDTLSKINTAGVPGLKDEFVATRQGQKHAVKPLLMQHQKCNRHQFNR